ncbi:MAG TPA: hypothetical protein VE999_16745 [Gemmataceae bacterium]|nr:hypothetical protein [Gemmataceae bacterium]
MSFEIKIKGLSDRYLADVRSPDITGFVDQLFSVAAETGTVACVFDGGKRLQFFVRPTETRVMGAASRPAQTPTTCIVEREAARSILRMICARLGVICKEHTTTDISPYGAKAVLNYDVQDQKRWSISFTNTPERQEFLIEAV